MMLEDCNKKLEENLIDSPYKRDQISNRECEIVRDDKSDDPNDLDEKEIRRILKERVFVSKRRKNLQKKIEIKEIDSSFVYTYSLKTWIERRQFFWQFKKNEFGIIDSRLENTWNAWNLCSKDKDKLKPFTDHVEKIVVKHSEREQSCFKCSHLMPTNCSLCGGNNKLIYYLNCKISWHNYKNDYVTGPDHIPIDVLNKLKYASGKILYEKEDQKVNPIDFEDNKEIKKAIEEYHKLHDEKSKKDKVCKQKQQIKKIRVFTVDYSYNQKVRRIFVFGDKDERDVLIPQSLNKSSVASTMLACIFI